MNADLDGTKEIQNKIFWPQMNADLERTKQSIELLPKKSPGNPRLGIGRSGSGLKSGQLVRLNQRKCKCLAC